ncbi:hypothetical protein BU16DRAFT_551110 [Lophium mytilinum]|uniref:Six-hairpin glycosidase n=1 Tax=Lophium mytilinum TaxID=390894 RepID=A0A6A6QM92_9PEZI|nr:hypothetical protein BU16DRAFT_551110 [Lophium mytilinum]
MRVHLILRLLLLSVFAIHSNAKELVPFKSTSFELGAMKATGWLQDQLVLSANGLAGHEFDFYRYVAKSKWLGGDWEYSELDESAPYWFNYIVPLAFTLDDPRLKSQAKKFLDYTLDNQAEDGWLGPETTKATRGIWARSLLLFGLTQYAEADPTETDRIQPGNDFDLWGFGVSRTHELPISIQWLYENYPRSNSEIIWETIELIFEGGRKGLRD